MGSAAAEIIDFQEYKAKRQALREASHDVIFPVPVLSFINGYWVWVMVL